MKNKMLSLLLSAALTLAEAGVTYKDGTYEGAGTGYANGTIKLSVTITGGKISAVELISQEKQSFWESKNVAFLFRNSQAK